MRCNRAHGVCAIVLVLLGLTASQAAAGLKLPALLSDNMVLQQGMKAPVWGWAGPGETVTVAIAGQSVTAKADASGAWRAHLSPLKPGGALEMTVSAAGQSIKVKNILVGEVWLCGGQSNMTHPTNLTVTAADEVAKAKFPQIRLFTVEPAPADEPQQDVRGKWVECSPQTVGEFSAVAFYFGRMIHQDLGVPVGLIHSSVGATEAESWMDLAVLKADPDFKPIFDFWAHQMKEHEGNVAGAAQRRADWEKAVAKAKAEGKPVPPEPPGIPFDWSIRFPGRLYNGMLAPLVPYGIRGVIWYQGESNYVGALYRKEFSRLIESWRKAWGQGDFPFLYVQLANYGERKKDPGPSDWAVTRQAQLEALSVPNAAMAVAIDLGSAAAIHPSNKQDVGKRLALAAEATVYGKKVAYSGPICEAMKVEGGAVRLTFQYVEGGLVAKGDGELKGFALAGEDRKFAWAKARIEGAAVVVSSDAVSKPAFVRYAWADNPECNLYNKAGLPASPFELPAAPAAPATRK